MTALNAIVLGIIEGITEFLPISSTGHLILASSLLKIPNSDFLKSFEIAIQLGAILSVIALYYKQLFGDIRIIKRVAVAFLPTMVLGFGFYKIMKTFFLGNNQLVLWSLFLGGILLIGFERFYHKTEDQAELATIPYKKAFLIGIFQSLAIVPGVSRSAATIIGGLSIGLKKKTIVEFSFLLAVPTMAAATGLDLLKSFNFFSTDQFQVLLVGFVVSFAVAILGIKFLLNFTKQHNFVVFGVYRIILALAFWLILAW